MSHGTSRIDALVAASTVTFVSVALLATGCGALGRARETAKQVKCGTQVKQAHAAFLMAAIDDGGTFPLPGRVNRRAVAGGQQVPGRGEPDESVNQHGNLWGVLVGRNYVGAQILVSPAEVNGNVMPCAAYNFNRINPGSDVYWDDSPSGFKCDLDKACNTSYATMPIDPSMRRTNQWRNTFDARFAILGNRGVKGGATTGPDFQASRTLAILGDQKSWEGNVCFNDNHVEFCPDFSPATLAPVTGAAPPAVDNLFRNDSFVMSGAERNADCWLVIQRAAAGTGGTASDSADGGAFASWD